MLMPLGKHKGEDLETIPTEYLEWIRDQPWVDEDLLEAIELELETR